MKKLFSCLLALTLLLSAATPVYADSTYVLDISSDQISHAVSDTLYGIFIEDISFACDGGLVSNLVNNGSFEYLENQDAGWLYSDLTSEMQNEEPMNASNTWYNVLSVNGSGIMENIGFPEVYRYKTYEVDEEKVSAPDMGFKEGENYAFSCWVRNIDFSGTISVYLDSKKNSGTMLQLNTESVGTAGWTKLEGSLKSAATEDGGLAIKLEGTGRLAIDFVQLIPESAYGYGTETWPYTSLRPDQFEALKNMNPSFVRFPGGCLAEGTELNNLYSWKNTIGALEERPQDFNLWRDGNNGKYYNNTNAMGYHEYFQLCEELSAEAVPIVNVGMVCQGRIAYDDHVIAHEKRMVMTDEQWQDYMVNERGWDPENQQTIDEYTEWIDSFEIHSDKDFEAWLDTVAYRPGTDAFTNYAQDILDLIEYANGDAQTTYWGALRAANGHTEPFNLHYIGLGNENWGALYFRNFAALYDIIKAKYPDITVVSSAGTWLEGEGYDLAWETINKDYPDTVVDEHYYTEQQYLFQHNDRYDSYDRDGAGVLIGEYAAKAQGFGTLITKNNLFSAMEEASFMTGMERNGDVVKMASYAPTFAKVNAQCWDHNLIWFDSQDVALTPDYYNQLLFANNTGNQYIDAAFTNRKGERISPTVTEEGVSEYSEGIYQSVTVNEEEQVLYVKLVSRDKDKTVRLNLDGFDNINAVSNLKLAHKYQAASNEIGKQRVAPEEETLTAEGNSIEVALDANSINVIRIAYGSNNGEAFYHLPDTMNLKTKAFVPAKNIAAAAIIALAFTVGAVIGFLLYIKVIKKRKRRK